MVNIIAQLLFIYLEFWTKLELKWHAYITQMKLNTENVKIKLKSKYEQKRTIIEYHTNVNNINIT